MISIPLICTLIAILACIYASYTDLKRGIIANKLTFPLIGLGIILNGINAFITGNLMILVYTLLFTGYYLCFRLCILEIRSMGWRRRKTIHGTGRSFTFTAFNCKLYCIRIFISTNGILSFPIHSNY